MSRRGPSTSLRLLPAVLLLVAVASLGAQPRPAQPDWAAVEPEALTIYQSLIRFDSTAAEKPEADWLKALFDREGIPAAVYALDPQRPNVVARLKGNGTKRPLLILGHRHGHGRRLKWTFRPSAPRATAGSCTAAAPSTTRTIWRRR
jgi:hypothetical protein